MSLLRNINTVPNQLVLYALLLIGCERPDYRAIITQAETDVVRSIPIANELCSTYPQYQVSLTTIVSQDPYIREVQIAAYAHERYIIYLNLLVEYQSAMDMRVVSYSNPKVRVVEVVSISRAKNGNILLEYGTNLMTTKEQVKILAKSGFEWESAGIELRRDDPVDGFLEYSQEQLTRDW